MLFRLLKQASINTRDAESAFSGGAVTCSSVFAVLSIKMESRLALAH